MRALLLSLALASTALAQPEVPPKLGFLVLLKVLTYDAGFDARGQGDFVVLVPFSKGSEAKAEGLVSELSRGEVKSIKQRKLVLRVVAAGEPLEGHAVLLSSALEQEALKPVVEAANRGKLYSLALSERAVAEGALLGVAQNAGKPQPVVNVATAKAQGVEFAASVLKVARTVSPR